MAGDLKAVIAAQVNAARVSKKLTQSELASRIERSVEAVSNIERAVSMPTLETLHRIGEATGKPLVFFFRLPDFHDQEQPRARQAKMRRLKEICDRLSDRDLDVAIRQVEAFAGR